MSSVRNRIQKGGKDLGSLIGRRGSYHDEPKEFKHDKNLNKEAGRDAAPVVPEGSVAAPVQEEPRNTASASRDKTDGERPTEEMRSKSRHGRTEDVHCLRHDSRQQQQASSIEEQLSITLRELNVVYENFDKLSLEVTQQDVELQHFKKQATSLTYENQALRAEIDQVKGHYRDQKQRFELNIQELTGQNMQLTDQLEEQKKNIVSAQSAAKTMLEQNRTFASSDSDVSHWFFLRSQTWYGWAKDYAKNSMNQVPEPRSDEGRELLVQLEQFVKLQDGSLPTDLLREKKLPYILLHGLLANFVCSEIFAKPFSILDSFPQLFIGQDVRAPSKEVTQDDGETGKELEGEQDTAVLISKMSDSVDHLYKFLSQVQQRDAHQWRAQLMRILATGEQTILTGSPDDGPVSLAEARAQHAHKLTEQFLKGAARCLLREPADLDHHQQFLTEEFKRALQFSSSLWSQRSVVRSLDLKALEQINGGRFQGVREGSDLELLEMHQSQRQDSSASAGLPLIMVVQPAVVACGTENGVKYDQISRVWLKARVWVQRA